MSREEARVSSVWPRDNASCYSSAARIVVVTGGGIAIRHVQQGGYLSHTKMATVV